MRVDGSRQRQLGSFALLVTFLLIGGCGEGVKTSGSNSAESSSSAGDTVSIAGDPTANVSADQTYSFSPVAKSSAGKTLAFSVTNLPAWATFSAATGQISGTPNDAEAGSYAGITISVTDGTAAVQLAPFTVTVTPITSGSATLTWVVPTQNTNGTPATDLAGFHVHYGTSVDAMNETVNVSGGSVTTYAIGGLAPGTYYFSVSAYNSQGVEGPASNFASKTI